MGLFSLLGGFIGSGKIKKGAKKASQLIYDSAIKGVDELGRQFNETQANFAPATALLAPGARHLGDLTGVNGAESQMSEIDALKASPLYQSLYRNGEEAVLQNASATGGLRGGNTERGLADFGSDTLSQTIQQKLAEYAGLVGIGTNAAGAVGNFGARSVEGQADLRNQGAGAKAQYQLIKGNLAAQNWRAAGSFGDQLAAAIAGGGGGTGGAFSFKDLFK